MGHDVFISYATEDTPAAEAVCAAIEAIGFSCWIAPRDIMPGDDYTDVIIEAINSSCLMVMVFSSHSNISVDVRHEVATAIGRKIRVIPLRIEDVNPSRGMQYLLANVHWLNATTPPLADHLERLADIVGRLVAKSQAEAQSLPI